ncbi:MAG TPA: hypothetical protein VF607_16395, partial [Verrucomicrobiae bacterium]
DCATNCGQKFFTLAFIIADRTGEPAWDGHNPIRQNFYGDQIAAIRKMGGDVILSFGGADGKEVALVQTNTSQLQTTYESIVEQYQLTWLDFDIEGKAMENQEANHRRNAALAGLQKKHPEVRITYTLPVDPNGIPGSAKRLLADAYKQGVKVYTANVMTMDFGEHFSKDKDLAEVCIASVQKAREQCQAIDPAIQIGITAMIGRNDVKSEVFTSATGQKLLLWAQKEPWVASVSFWAINRDAGKSTARNENLTSGIEQAPWEFTRLFQTFTTMH